MSYSPVNNNQNSFTCRKMADPQSQPSGVSRDDFNRSSFQKVNHLFIHVQTFIYYQDVNFCERCVALCENVPYAEKSSFVDSCSEFPVLLF